MPLCRSTPVQAKIGQVQNTKRNVAKLVGLTSSEGFRVIDIIMLCKTMFERPVVFYLATVCAFIIMRESSELKTVVSSILIESAVSFVGRGKLMASTQRLWRLSGLSVNLILFTSLYAWPGGVVVRTLDLRLRRSRVRLPASSFQATTLGKLFTHMYLCHQAL